MIIGLKDKLEPILNEPQMKLWEYGLVCSIAIQNIELHNHIAICSVNKLSIIINYQMP